MAGIDKIVDQIMSKAQSEAQSILAEAQKKADEITADFKADGNKSAAAIAEKSKSEIESYGNRVQSTIDLNRRQAFLQAKQELISEILEKAYNELSNCPDTEYFDMILKLLEQNVQSGNGEVAFCEKDLKRMPADFVSKADEIAKAAGGSLKLSDKKPGIENGFVLVYGDIEENCSLRAIFDARREELVDLVHGILS